MHESRRSVDKRTCTAFVPMPPEALKIGEAVKAACKEQRSTLPPLCSLT